MKDKITPIDECPYCNSDAGFYTKVQAKGSIRHCMNFDGSEADNSEMYDFLSFTGGEYAYCCNCNKRLFRMPK